MKRGISCSNSARTSKSVIGKITINRISQKKLQGAFPVDRFRRLHEAKRRPALDCFMFITIYSEYIRIDRSMDSRSGSVGRRSKESKMATRIFVDRDGVADGKHKFRRADLHPNPHLNSKSPRFPFCRLFFRCTRVPRAIGPLGRKSELQ